MTDDVPIPYRWMERHCPECGTLLEPALVPHRRFWTRCAQMFQLGCDYILRAYSQNDQRSAAEHRRYFAELHELYVNLPETDPWSMELEDDVRKLALIETGWHDSQEFAFATRKEALRMAPIMYQLVRKHNVVKTSVFGTKLVIYTAKSQKQLPYGMNKHDFRASSEAVLELLRLRVGVTSDASQSAAAAGANA